MLDNEEDNRDWESQAPSTQHYFLQDSVFFSSFRIMSGIQYISWTTDVTSQNSEGKTVLAITLSYACSYSI